MRETKTKRKTYLATPDPWFLRISVVRFSRVHIFKKYLKNSPNIQFMQFSLQKRRNSFTHVVLFTSDLSASDLAPADFCQT